ncbi:UNVERIFIED_CONTAM: hypothetical protein RKD50_009391 [Streptomyces canus]
MPPNPPIMPPTSLCCCRIPACQEDPRPEVSATTSRLGPASSIAPAALATWGGPTRAAAPASTPTARGIQHSAVKIPASAEVRGCHFRRRRLRARGRGSVVRRAARQPIPTTRTTHRSAKNTVETTSVRNPTEDRPFPGMPPVPPPEPPVPVPTPCIKPLGRRTVPWPSSADPVNRARVVASAPPNRAQSRSAVGRPRRRKGRKKPTASTMVPRNVRVSGSADTCPPSSRVRPPPDMPPSAPV